MKHTVEMTSARFRILASAVRSAFPDPRTANSRRYLPPGQYSRRLRSLRHTRCQRIDVDDVFIDVMDSPENISDASCWVVIYMYNFPALYAGGPTAFSVLIG